MSDVNGDKPAKRLRLEVLVANPPTRKCRKVTAIMEEMTRQFPDRVQLDIYVIGQKPPVLPTGLYLQENCKLRRVPSAYVNGHLVARKAVPDPFAVVLEIGRELAKGPESWQ